MFKGKFAHYKSRQLQFLRFTEIHLMMLQFNNLHERQTHEMRDLLVKDPLIRLRQ